MQNLAFATFFRVPFQLRANSFLRRCAVHLFYIPKVCRAVRCAVCDFPRTQIVRDVCLTAPETAPRMWKVGIISRIKGNLISFFGFFSKNFGNIFRSVFFAEYFLVEIVFPCDLSSTFFFFFFVIRIVT